MALYSDAEGFPPRETRDCEHENIVDFGDAKAENVLEFFLGTPDIISNILFLGSGDLRNALLTIAKLSEAFNELNIYLNDDFNIVTARNILLAHIMLADNFDPTDPSDLNYLWDVWYSLQWTEDTNKRFIKDVKDLLSRQWTENLKIDSAGLDFLNQILHHWLAVALGRTSASVKNIKSILSKRSKLMVENIMEGTGTEIPEIEYALSSFRLRSTWINYLNATTTGINFQRSLSDQVDCYHKCGNCLALTSNISSLNPTLFSGKQGEITQVKIASCPFYAYLPVPFEEQLASDFGAIAEDAVTFCKNKLQRLVSSLRDRKHRISLHFLFGDCLELCLREESMKKKFHVIHCSASFSRNVGLANIISASSGCLANPDAVLLTNLDLYVLKIHLNLPVVDFIEGSLCCPVSLTPTLYGVRLMNHLQLGSPCPFKLHDDIVKNLVNVFKWQLSPGYSGNIPLDVSHSVLETAIGKLVGNRFGDSSFARRLNTFSYILQSLFSRCSLLQNYATLQSLYLPKTGACNRFTWLTELAWMKGEPVARYSFPNLVRNIIPDAPQLFVGVMPKEEVNFPEDSPIGGISKRQWAGLCQYKGVTGYFHLKKDMLQDPSFAFLIFKDHDPSLLFTIMDDEEILFYLELRLLNCKVIENPTPFIMQQTPTQPEAVETLLGLYVLKCIETEGSYELEVNVRGVQISNASDVAISTDREHPSQSAHQLTLSVESLEPLILQFPWPFLSDAVEVSLHKRNKKNKNKFIRLILKKSLNDPFPTEFGGRSKWDVNLLKPWKDIEGHGSLKMHVEAQFHCDYLSMEKLCFKSSSVSLLDEVREIVRAIFYGNSNNSFLFAVCLSDDPVLYLRVQPIVRFSPHGSPLIIVSVLDYQLALLLMAKGKLDPAQYQADYHRIFTEGVSRQVCNIRASSAQEMDMFRYTLRVNSTRMRRSVWQSKNLPRGENSPWLATFLSPLYTENTFFDCSKISDKVYGLLHRKEISLRDITGDSATSFIKFSSLNQCASCFVKKIKLNKCSRCHKIAYCSISCQKMHWSIHKRDCS